MSLSKKLKRNHQENEKNGEKIKIWRIDNMKPNDETWACLICGKPIVYYEKEKEFECSICHKKFMSNASCENGHFICDSCHGNSAMIVIASNCLKSESKNPFEIVEEAMKTKEIHMHGPEHHVLVGASILTSFKNAGGVLDFENALEQMISRGGKYPGGSCGFWGCCGAAVSIGMAMSIITKATPLTKKSWSQSNAITGKILQRLAEQGGPRCCKRNSFSAVIEAVDFIKEEFNITMELPDRIECHFSSQNRECLKENCPYFVRN